MKKIIGLLFIVSILVGCDMGVVGDTYQDTANLRKIEKGITQ